MKSAPVGVDGAVTLTPGLVFLLNGFGILGLGIPDIPGRGIRGRILLRLGVGGVRVDLVGDEGIEYGAVAARVGERRNLEREGEEVGAPIPIPTPFPTGPPSTTPTSVRI